jgi:hypothetical protein
MTQNKMVESQPLLAAELWTAYDGLREQEEALRQRTLRLSVEHLAACRAVPAASQAAAWEVYRRFRHAVEAYRAVFEQRTELYELAMKAAGNPRPEGATPAG